MLIQFLNTHCISLNSFGFGLVTGSTGTGSEYLCYKSESLSVNVTIIYSYPCDYIHPSLVSFRTPAYRTTVAEEDKEMAIENLAIFDKHYIKIKK